MDRFFSKIIFYVLFFLSGCLSGMAQYEKLDSIINLIPKIRSIKDDKIEELKHLSSGFNSDGVNLDILEHIFDEYHHYNFDSAMYYADVIYQLAEEGENEEYKNRALLHIANLNVENGNLEVADNILEDMDINELSGENVKEYFTVKYLLNKSLKLNSKNDKKKKLFHKEMTEALKGLISTVDRNSNEYYFAIAEKLRLADEKNDSSLKFYLTVLERTPVNSELYTKAAYSVANYYKEKDNKELCRDWLIKSAVSEIEISMNKSEALEELALMLYNEDDRYLNKATNYYLAANDNALRSEQGMRIREMSGRISEVLPVYLQDLKNKDFNFHMSLILLVLALAALTLMIVYIKRNKLQIQNQKNLLEAERMNIVNLRRSLERNQTELINSKNNLILTQRRYKDIHIKRENLAKVWMDICEAQINKNRLYKTSLTSLVKSKQREDVIENKILALNDEETEFFMRRFDKAFIDLYPNFTDEINKLLKNDSRITQKNPYVLTTELRICALIKLGIKESSVIADLLFVSVQTVYNNRTRLRNRALDKERFEEQIRDIKI